MVGVKEMTRPFWFLFNFEKKNCFWDHTPWGLYGVEWDERFRTLCTF